jgi:hypothetical protein
MVIIVEIQELFAGELCNIVGNNGVWDPEAMNNINKEEHRLLRFNSRDRPSLNPLQELVDGDKQVGKALGAFWGGPTRSRP